MFPPLVHSGAVKHLNFRERLPIQTTHHTFLESRHAGVTENPFIFLPSEGSQKKVSPRGLLSFTMFAGLCFSRKKKTIKACSKRLKSKTLLITKILIKMRIEKIAMARETFGLRNVWASDGRILHVDYDKITAINATKKQKETFPDQSTNFFRQLFVCVNHLVGKIPNLEAIHLFSWEIVL